MDWEPGQLKTKGNLCSDGPTALPRACVEVVVKQEADIVHSQTLITLQAVLQTLQASKHNQKMSIVHANKVRGSLIYSSHHSKPYSHTAKEKCYCILSMESDVVWIHWWWKESYCGYLNFGISLNSSMFSPRSEVPMVKSYPPYMRGKGHAQQTRNQPSSLRSTPAFQRNSTNTSGSMYLIGWLCEHSSKAVCKSHSISPVNTRLYTWDAWWNNLSIMVLGVWKGEQWGSKNSQCNGYKWRTFFGQFVQFDCDSDSRFQRYVKLNILSINERVQSIYSCSFHVQKPLPTNILHMENFTRSIFARDFNKIFNRHTVIFRIC